jgi:hypothetical protein
MTDEKPTVAEGAEYVVFFEGGPSDGRTDKRVSTDGSYDDLINDFVLIDGTETWDRLQGHLRPMMGDQLQVHYAVDVSDSDPVEDPDDRRESTN